ncbi:hypothetical protein SKAU_G00101510 [Synaphobranchus kaupii]|uniref:Uncharacterized protein n=1 Tax=Synaphobranchus kaupii TaxID=118154 RepID=A0A9Q1FZG2_SYNKA|nr:hypothetical protein SKAU_G00101510 [Synaphobranchus kaupii]
MEHSFADLLGDAFSDTSLPCYQEGELDFESLNLHEGNGEGNSNGEFERLPALTEVDEHDDAEEEEEARCVSMGTSEEEPNWRRSGLPQGEDWGDTVDLEGQEVEDRCEITAEDEDLTDDRHAGGSLLDRSQIISLRGGCLEGDQMESGENTRSGEQTHDLWKAREFSTQRESSKEDHGVECPQADVPHGESDSGGEGEEEVQRGLKDGRGLSEVLSFKKQEGEKETLGYTDTDSDIDIDADTDADAVADTDIVADVTPVAGIVTGSEAGVVTEADAAADAEGDGDTWTGGLAEECCFSVTAGSLDYLLHADPFRGELKEFSEADCGVIGEGYAEYPSEGEEERRDEEENVEQESERGLGRLSEAWTPQAGAELSEWELMEGVVEVESCEEQERGENKGVGSAGGREEDGSKGRYEERDDVGLDIEEEMELSDSSSLRSEGDAEVLNEGSEPESAGAHGKRLLDWTEHQGSDEGEDFNERKKDNDSYGETIYKIKWTGEEWDPGREEYLKLAVRQEQSSADEEGILQSITQDQTNKDKENVLHVMTHQQACADEEDVCHVENEEGRVDGGSGLSSGGCPGDALGGWSPGAAPMSVSTSDCSSRLSESESSSSDSEPWPHRAMAPAALRDLSVGLPHLQPESYSQEDELFSGVYTVPGAEEGEFANEEVEEEEEEEEERNWDQERERIQAFYRYYDDEEEDYDMRREGQGHSNRKHMVRFCLDALPLQQDSDSSDTDMVSSSSEGAEDSDTAVTVTSEVAGAVTSEVAGAVTWMPVKTEGNGERESHRRRLSLLLQECQITQAEMKELNAELRAQHQSNRVTNTLCRVPSVLRSALKLSLVSMLGVIMF